MRKGTIIDFLWISIVIVAMSIMIFLAVYLKDQIFPQITGEMGAGAGTDTLNTVSGQFRIFDYIFLFTFAAFFILPIMFAYLVPTNPVFYIINVIMILIFFAVIPALSNVVREFVSQSEFAGYAAGGGNTTTYPIITYLMRYLPQISIGFGIILTIAMFAKPKEGSI